MTTPVRCSQRLGVTIAALIFGPVFMVGPLGFCAWFVASGHLEWSTALLPVLALSASAFFAYHMTQNYHWVELDGGVVRGRKFWTRRLVAQPVSELEAIIPLGAVVRSVETVITDKLLGQVRGYELRFKRGPKIFLVRHDMKCADEFVTVLQAEWLAAKKPPTS